MDITVLRSPCSCSRWRGLSCVGLLICNFLQSLNAGVFCWVLVWQGRKEELDLRNSSGGEPLATHGQWQHSYHPLASFGAQRKRVAHHCPWQVPGPVTPALGRNQSAVPGRTEAGRKSVLKPAKTCPTRVNGGVSDWAPRVVFLWIPRKL